MKNSLLVINCSGRTTRSLSRRLTARFTNAWRALNPAGSVIHRDVGLNPPSPVNEPWIAAAFAVPEERTDAMNEALRTSETLIAEITTAETIVIGTPIYNFGMPAQLKAYFDQIVRIGRTFSIDPTSSDPYRPLLAPKPVIVVSAAGDGSMHPGGALAHLNFLEPHVATILGFVGLTEVTFVRVGYEEYQDDRHRESLAAAERDLDHLATMRAAIPATR